MTRVKEKEWFEKHPQYYDIQHVCGIDRLMDTMISLLADKMVTEVPNLVREMKNLKKEVNKLCAMSFLMLLLFFLSKYCTQESSLLLSRDLFSPCLAYILSLTCAKVTLEKPGIKYSTFGHTFSRNSSQERINLTGEFLKEPLQ